MNQCLLNLKLKNLNVTDTCIKINLTFLMWLVNEILFILYVIHKGVAYLHTWLIYSVVLGVVHSSTVFRINRQRPRERRRFK